MTTSAKSLFYFGVYVIGAGLLFLTIPETFISLLQLPTMSDGWARVVGLLALVIGALDIMSARNNIQQIIRFSIYTRLGFALGTSALVVIGQMPWTLILLGGVDFIGALWTMMALRSEASNN